MAGKVIIHTPSSMGPMGKFNIYIDGEKVAVAKHGEITTLPVYSDCKLQVRCSADMKTAPLPLSADKLTEIDFEPGLFGIKPVILRQEEYDSDNEVEEPVCEDAEIDTEVKEYRMRCNVCGHIFCYTDEDVKKNAGNAGMGALAALGGLASALGGGTVFHTHHLQGQADRYTDKIVDYNRCPSCNSSDISEMKEEPVSQPASVSAPVSSPIEEIKKYKELLDMGIITQEEFDIKKKQLLNL